MEITTIISIILLVTAILLLIKNWSLKTENETLLADNSDMKEKLSFEIEKSKTLGEHNLQLSSEIDLLYQRIKDLDKVEEGVVLESEEIKSSDKKMPYFELFKDSASKFRWRFKSINNKIVADSAESYTSKQNRDKGLNILIDSIKSGSYSVKEEKAKES